MRAFLRDKTPFKTRLERVISLVPISHIQLTGERLGLAVNVAANLATGLTIAFVSCPKYVPLSTMNAIFLLVHPAAAVSHEIL